MSLFADYNLPFAIALGVMLLFGHLQIIGLTGASLGDMVKGATEAKVLRSSLPHLN